MRKSFILHNDSLNVLDILTDEQAGKLFKAIKNYQNGVKQELDFGINIAFMQFENQFKRDEEKYESVVERNKINGSKGGRPKNPTKPKETQNNPVGFLETQNNPTEPKKADSDSKNDSDSKSDSKKENDFLTAILDFEYLAVLDLWLQHKKERKEKYKPTGLKTLAEKIKEDYKTVKDFETAVKYSISNNWAGIYPPKQQQNNQTPTAPAPNKMVY